MNIREYSKPLVIVLIGLTTLLVLWIAGWTVHVRGIHNSLAIQSIAEACLLYYHDFGVPPSSVEDMIACNYTQKGPDFASVWGRPDRIPLGLLRKIHLSFPQDPDGLYTKEGHLINRKTGQEQFLITIAEVLPLIDFDETSCRIWKDWIRVKHGPSLPDWLKSCIERRHEYEQRTQTRVHIRPATRPSQ